ncbi:hypothetical protein B6I21_09285 [candidate division KSB1 bacterium 4572_119]|nr:MAG: hypothetical protein B6I21_09285 [candidate division KSB1 bacterium 4572_119]
MVYKQFEGVFAPILTPFSSRDFSIDYEFVRRHLEFLNQKGIQGVLVSGTNGEFPSLSVEERKNLISWVLKFRGNLKVIMQTGTSSFVDTIGLSEYGKEKGVDAVLIAVPYYYKNINDVGLIDYYIQIFNRIQLPIFLYNMPQVTKIKITGTVIKALLGFQNFLGIKESTGLWEETKYYIESFRQLHVFVGNDILIKQSLDIGAGGCITAVANTFPELLTSLLISLKKKEDVQYVQQQLTAYRKLLQQFPLQAASKYILKLRGLGISTVRPPLQDLSESQKRELERGLEKLGFNFQEENISF